MKIYSDEPLFDDDDRYRPDDDDSEQWDYVAPEDDPSAEDWEREDDNWEALRQLPERLRQLQAMFDRNAWSLVRNKAFYEQALFMADYADEADIVPFHYYFPVYRDMTPEQLRSYFTVRTMLRQGKTPEAPLSYIFVYIYELLMQVGISSAEEGYEILTELLEHYGESEPRLKKHLVSWLRDYVVYYGLTAHAAEVFADEQREDADALVLRHYADATDDDLFRVVAAVTTYKYANSAVWKRAEADVRAVMPRVIRAVAPLLEQREHHHLDTLAFGLKTHRSHAMFFGAVFYAPHPVREATFDISPRRQWRCIGGLWAEDLYRHPLVPIHKKGEPFNLLFHETIRQLALALHLSSHLKPQLQDPVLSGVITGVIRSYLTEKAAAARPKVSIDLTKLDGIREDAAVVRDALLTEDEQNAEGGTLNAEGEMLNAEGGTRNAEGEMLNAEGETRNAEGETRNAEGGTLNTKGSGIAATAVRLSTPDPPTTAAPAVPSSPLSPSAIAFLRLVLAGQDPSAYLRSIHTPAGVLIDAINEKMMDLIGDIVLEDDGTRISIIEDYRCDIEEMLQG